MLSQCHSGQQCEQILSLSLPYHGQASALQPVRAGSEPFLLCLSLQGFNGASQAGPDLLNVVLKKSQLATELFSSLFKQGRAQIKMDTETTLTKLVGDKH